MGRPLVLLNLWRSLAMKSHQKPQEPISAVFDGRGLSWVGVRGKTRERGLQELTERGFRR